MVTTASHGLRSYAADEILRDGAPTHIRAIGPDDKDRLLEHFHARGPRPVYYRFLGTKKRLTAAELSGREHIVGVGRYVAHDGQAKPRRAEVAFAVIDEHQGRGIGALLLAHLTRVARAAGITEFEADVLGDNSRMLHVFTNRGFAIARSFEGGVVHVSLPAAETPAVNS